MRKNYQRRRIMAISIASALAAFGCIKFLSINAGGRTIRIVDEMSHYVSESDIVAEETSAPAVDLTDAEIILLSRLVESEASTESAICKRAVASVVLNRMEVESKTLYEVVYEDGQFDTTTDLELVIPSAESQGAALYVYRNGSVLPTYVTYFRADQYHDWGDQTPFLKIDNTYFSYSESLKESFTEG